MRTMKIFCCVATFGAIAAGAHGYSFLNTLYNTGMGADGNVLSTATKSLDPHYALQSNPVGFSSAYAVSGFGPYWNTADYVDSSSGTTYRSKWISPIWNSGEAGGVNNFPNSQQFNYTLTFDLGQGTPVGIAGQWMSDNGSGTFNGTVLTSQILVNGKPTGQTIGDTAITAWNPFDLSGTYNGQNYFQAGTNTITFSVANWPTGFPNPTGLRVVFTSAEAVPEPFTFTILGAGVLTLAIRKRRARKA
jgi:hypothetical protein